MNPNYKNNICKVLFEESWYSYDFAQPRNITPYASRLEWNRTFMTTINRLYFRIASDTDYRHDVSAISSSMFICEILGNQLYHSETTKMLYSTNVGDIELYPVGKVRGFLDISLASQRIFKKGRGLMLEKNNMRNLSDDFLLLWCKKTKKGGIINIRNE
jgi:hypothetical protein